MSPKDAQTPCWLRLLKELNVCSVGLSCYLILSLESCLEHDIFDHVHRDLALQLVKVDSVLAEDLEVVLIAAALVQQNRHKLEREIAYISTLKINITGMHS